MGFQNLTNTFAFTDIWLLLCSDDQIINVIKTLLLFASIIKFCYESSCDHTVILDIRYKCCALTEDCKNMFTLKDTQGALITISAVLLVLLKPVNFEIPAPSLKYKQISVLSVQKDVIFGTQIHQKKYFLLSESPSLILWCDSLQVLSRRRNALCTGSEELLTIPTPRSPGLSLGIKRQMLW